MQFADENTTWRLCKAITRFELAVFYDQKENAHSSAKELTQYLKKYPGLSSFLGVDQRIQAFL